MHEGSKDSTSRASHNADGCSRPDSDSKLASHWRDAARDPRICAALEAIYAGVARAVEQQGPACWASGRCCNFARTGHLLYVTGLEAAYCVLRWANDPGRSHAPRSGGVVSLTQAQVASAKVRGDCPFLEGTLCGAHRMKPLGCRVYFCDSTAQNWQHALSEAALQQIRAVHDAYNVAYRYAEWRSLLALLAENDPSPDSPLREAHRP